MFHFQQYAYYDFVKIFDSFRSLDKRYAYDIIARVHMTNYKPLFVTIGSILDRLFT